MPLSSAILPSFGALALAVLLLWAPPIRGRRDWTWCTGLALVCLAGIATGSLDWRAPLFVGGFAALAWQAREAQQTWLRTALLVLTGLSAFLFALHRVPGFFNPVLAEGIVFSSGAPALTLRLNYDTVVAGIVLMGVFCRPLRTAEEWLAMLRHAWPVPLATLAVVLGVGLALGYVLPDLKWTPYSAAFLAMNLLFTCVTEEAFFRGLLLERMAAAMQRWRAGAALALVLSAVLFGLAHARGGAPLVLLATVAGLFYGWAYLRARHIEGAILTHFVLNAVHFLAFTYPALAR
ncbi:lysostaphin resistance A-like protein [Massilia sp. 2TAF26]|uniref:CPBP family intramembrane glutamic endopeptidase n=1 Tax=Massilia sp. 2TAF26 TaxID=3233012 RepID=UPI003F9C467C